METKKGNDMQKTIRIGSRESRLAQVQAELIRAQIQAKHPEIRTEIITMKTSGDKILNQSLSTIGGKGLFVKELEKALLDGRIDISVHSLKDVPMVENEELPILAYGKREDPRDVLIFKPGRHTFPEEGILGTSSQRRKLQMLNIYPNCRFRVIRGNVQTRLRKLQEEEYDGTILALAGLKRLGMESVIGRIFETDEMIPAAGQGILAIQGRRGEDYSWLDGIDDSVSRIAVQAERTFVRVLDGDCTSPTAAHAVIRGTDIKLTGLYEHPVTKEIRTGEIIGNCTEAQKLGEELANRLMKTYN